MPLAWGWFAGAWISGAMGSRTFLSTLATTLGIACILCWGAAILMTFAVMLHLAEAARRERDELEEAIEGGRTEPILPQGPTPDRPEIELE